MDFNSVGNEGAVCVKSGGRDFGVMLYTNTGIGCVTCKYGKSNCQHVQKMVSVIENTSDEDIPNTLLPFLAARSRTKVQKMSTNLKCVSSKRIAFKTPSSQAIVMVQSLEFRFNISNSICHLKEDNGCIPCLKCGQCLWTEVPSEKLQLVILPTLTLRAIGKLESTFLSTCIV